MTWSTLCHSQFSASVLLSLKPGAILVSIAWEPVKAGKITLLKGGYQVARNSVPKLLLGHKGTLHYLPWETHIGRARTALLQWHNSNKWLHDKVMQARRQPELAYLQIRICFCTLANSDLWEDCCSSAQPEHVKKGNRSLGRFLPFEPTAVVWRTVITVCSRVTRLCPPQGREHWTRESNHTGPCML